VWRFSGWKSSERKRREDHCGEWPRKHSDGQHQAREIDRQAAEGAEERDGEEEMGEGEGEAARHGGEIIGLGIRLAALMLLGEQDNGTNEQRA
jgi:hypothetical protein